MSEDDGKLLVEKLKQELEAERAENEKLQTRLKGYQTVGKSLSEVKKERDELQKRVFELEEKGMPSCEQMTNDAISAQGLTDLESANSSQGTPRGTSSSFTVLGKTSRDHQVNDSAQKPQSLGNIPSNENHGINAVPHRPPKQDNTKAEEKESAGESFAIVASPEKLHSSNCLEEGKKSPKSDILGETIQVFPESMQSAGSNFLYSGERAGDQSCTNSSRRGPMSIVAVPNRSIPSYEYVELTRRDENDPENSKSDKSQSFNVMHQGMTQPTHSVNYSYSGTGARPKNFHSQPNKPNDEEEFTNNDPKPVSSNASEVKASNQMVNIPCENSNAYRINNAPMLSYGRGVSNTEISDLTSLGSPVTSLNIPKMVSEAGTENYNNLNTAVVGLRNSQRMDDFVIVEGVPPISSTTDPGIPTIKPMSDQKYGNDSMVVAELKKELESSRKRATQIHLANKEWKESWDILRKQKDDEIEQLHVKLCKLSQERDHMKREMEYHIMSQKEELNQMNMAKKDAEKAYQVLLQGRSQEKQLLEKLKQDYGTLHQEKRSLEVQLEVLQKNRPIESQRQTEASRTYSELETELAVVKRQVSLFMEDFNKEHQERLLIEKAIQREKDLNRSLEAKLKNSHSLLKSRDEDLRQKSKLVSDLQFQVEDMKLKLEVEQRRAAIYPSIDNPSHPSVGQNVEVSMESEPGKTNSVAAHVNLNVHATAKPQKWRCIACTYDNKMSHKKCDICSTPYVQGHNELN